MFGFYIKNNMGVGFQTFAGGLFAGLGSLVFLTFNSLVFAQPQDIWLGLKRRLRSFLSSLVMARWSCKRSSWLGLPAFYSGIPCSHPAITAVLTR